MNAIMVQLQIKWLTAVGIVSDVLDRLVCQYFGEVSARISAPIAKPRQTERPVRVGKITAWEAAGISNA